MATIHTLVIDADDLFVFVSADEQELWKTLRDNYGDGFEGDDGALVDYVVEQGVVFHFEQHEVKLEILHQRDPDSSCDITVFADGVENFFTEENIDPGAGYTREDWDEHIEGVKSAEDYSPTFKAAVLEALEGASDSDYIEDED